ncbi:MAG: TA system VapC family ribonuclease toxin [Bryobacteraceae bacterium]
MTYLFDVNVLIAVADPAHVFHESIHNWLASHQISQWATCPLTENGFIRILSQPAYRGTRCSTQDAILLLREMKLSTKRRHVFWPDSVSLTDLETLHLERIAGPAQITDIYLAALALRNKGKLVTFDQAIPWQAIVNAKPSVLSIPVSN